MAASVNRVVLIGHLGKDPEVRFSASGDGMCNFSIATSEQWKDKSSGEKKEQTEWHRISVFGKLAEVCGQYLKKGSQVYIEGSIRTRKWVDKNGQDQYTTEIRCDTMKMLGSRQGDSQGGGNRDAAPPSRSSSQGSGNGLAGEDYSPRPDRKPPPSFDDLESDIQF